jgi:hypothetical protein
MTENLDQQACANDEDDPGGVEEIDADHPLRLQRDLATWKALQAADFTGPLWKAHIEDVGGYATRVFEAWGRDGTFFTRLRGDASIQRRDRLPSQGRLTQEEVHDLVGFLMLGAIPTHRNHLANGDWKVEMGRGLRSYFLQGMKFELVRRYWSWRQPENRPEEALETHHEVRAGQVLLKKKARRFVQADASPLHGEVYAWSEPEDAAMLAAEIRDAIEVAAPDSLSRRIVAMEASHFEDQEIAVAVGCSTKAIQMRLRRFRERAAARRRIA